MVSKEERIERITNRILINVGIGALAYILLWVLFSKLYMPNVTTFAIAGLFAVAGVVLYYLAKKKELPLKNYAYMFFAFCAALLFTRLAQIVSLFIGQYRCAALTNIPFYRILFNTSFEVKVIAILGAFYLVMMAVVSTVQIYRISKEKGGKVHIHKKKKR